jgi:hypothetical protein
VSGRRWLLAGGVVALAVAAFLLFRPDTLFTEVETAESLEEAFVSTSTTGVSSAPTTTTIPETTAGPTTTLRTTTSTMPSGPLATQTGQLFGIDHGARGTATIYEQDGAYVLRFEDDTDIQNGPDLYVWLLAGTEYEGGTPADYLDLGTLKGTVGSQNYELPPEYDPATHRAVLIWCLRFAVPFAAAPLA